MPPIIEMLNHADRHDMMMRCDELAEREWEQSKEEGRRIGFLKLIFSQEEKSTQPNCQTTSPTLYKQKHFLT